MFSKLVRIGRDAEIRNLPNGTPVLNFPAVYDIGYGDKKRGQWIDCTMFGARAEKVAEHFTKGKQIVIHAVDVEIQTWQKNDGSGEGYKLACKIVEFDFVSDGSKAAQGAPAQVAQSAQAPQGQNQNGTQQSNMGMAAQHQPAPSFNEDDGDPCPF